MHEFGHDTRLGQQPADRRAGRAGPGIHPVPGHPRSTAGEAWRQLRNWWIIPLGGLVILFVVLAVALYYRFMGPIGGHGRQTGRLIERFTHFERVVHWSTAITFTILAVSGAVMSFGKFFLLPIIGGQLFGWLTWLLKTSTTSSARLFAVSMVDHVLHLPAEQLADARRREVADLRAGGMLGGEHPPSHRFNAGEKIVFWGGMLVLGVVRSSSRASRSTRSFPGST